jgi:hypothetical protein
MMREGEMLRSAAARSTETSAQVRGMKHTRLPFRREARAMLCVLQFELTHQLLQFLGVAVKALRGHRCLACTLCGPLDD